MRARRRRCPRPCTGRLSAEEVALSRCGSQRTFAASRPTGMDDLRQSICLGRSSRLSMASRPPPACSPVIRRSGPFRRLRFIAPPHSRLCSHDAELAPHGPSSPSPAAGSAPGPALPRRRTSPHNRDLVEPAERSCSKSRSPSPGTVKAPLMTASRKLSWLRSMPSITPWRTSLVWMWRDTRVVTVDYSPSPSPPAKARWPVS